MAQRTAARHFLVRKNKFAPESDSGEEPTVDSEREPSPPPLDARLHHLTASLTLCKETLARKKDKARKLRTETANLQEKADKNEEAFAYLKDAHRTSKQNEHLRETLKQKAAVLSADIARLQEKVSEGSGVFQRAAALRLAIAQGNGLQLEALSIRELQQLAQSRLSNLMRLQAAVSERVEKVQEADLCAVCLTRAKSEITLPCGHFVLCRGCLAACVRCPVCRARVAESYSVA
jgi:chromosome segregation ATPase